MLQKEILEREKKNYNKIYLYIDAESNLCYAYDFSACIVTKLFDVQNTGIKEVSGIETPVYTLQLPLQFVVEQFDNFNTLVDDQFIKVIIKQLSRCIQWRVEFEELKMQQRQRGRAIKERFLGFFRFA